MEDKRSPHAQIFDYIKSLPEQSNFIVIPALFIKKFGVKAALFLSQVLYWSGKGKGNEEWFYKSYQEWKKELGLTRGEIDTARKKLKKLNLLETKIKRVNGSPVVHYRVKVNVLADWICEKRANGFAKKEQMDLLKSSKTRCLKVANPDAKNKQFLYDINYNKYYYIKGPYISTSRKEKTEKISPLTENQSLNPVPPPPAVSEEPGLPVAVSDRELASILERITQKANVLFGPRERT